MEELLDQLRNKLSALADAIRARTGESADMTLDEMIEIVAGLPMKDLVLEFSDTMPTIEITPVTITTPVLTEHIDVNTQVPTAAMLTDTMPVITIKMPTITCFE